MEIKLVIHTALKEEAKVFLETYKFKKILAITSYNFYYDKLQKILLIIANIGAFNTISALTYAAAYFKLDKYCVFLNFGIAGHISFPLGRILQINKFSQENEIKNFHKTYIYKKLNYEITSCKTFIKPQNKYPKTDLVDQESYHFIQSALKFTDIDNCFCFKMISDNSKTPFDRSKTIKMLDQAKSELKIITDKILLFQNTYLQPYQNIDFSDLSKNHKFSHSELIKVTNIIENLHNLEIPYKHVFIKTNSAKEIMQELENIAKHSQLSF